MSYYRQRRIVGYLSSVGIIAASMFATAPRAFAQVALERASWRRIPTTPQAPAGAPNILLILTDDVGFGATSTFGGPIVTPTFDRLARAGLRYTQFNTAAMCSPTRAALLTGRNHHEVGTGTIADISTDDEGYTSVIPTSAATIGRVLRDAGYATAWFGKNHNTPVWESGPAGPFDRWPNSWGFEYFYGFNGAATDQFSPSLIENQRAIRPPADPDYVLDRDLADQTIAWITRQTALRPEAPFFAYLAPGTMHIPQQAPAEAIARYRGAFDSGWDAMREATLARQKTMGIIPADTIMSPRPAELPAWSSLSPSEQRLYARMMEVAAAQLDYMDRQIGRIVDELDRLGKLDNTLIIYIQGDNGAAMEMEHGLTNSRLYATKFAEKTDDMVKRIDLIGGPDANGGYPAGWAWATNAPFPWGKQIASHLGGQRAGLVVSWPRRIKTAGIRSQFGHVIDVAPTIYDAIGIRPPDSVNGVRQQPIDGASLLGTFISAAAPSPHRKQYFEMLGNRAYYKDGWMAATIPPAPPWVLTTPAVAPADYRWALFDLRKDFAQAKDVSDRYPKRLASLRAEFNRAAARFHVNPIRNDFIDRAAPGLRPPTLPAAPRYEFRPGDTRYAAAFFPKISAGWEAHARIRLVAAGSSGPIVVQGSRFSSFSLTLESGVPTVRYDPIGQEPSRQLLRGGELAPGIHDIVVAFRKTGEEILFILEVDGRTVSSVPIPEMIGVSGDAYVGRPATDDRRPSSTSISVENVVITIAQ